MSRYSVLFLPCLLVSLAQGQSTAPAQCVIMLMEVELHMRTDASDHLIVDRFRDGVRCSQDRIPLAMLRAGTFQQSPGHGAIIIACPQDVPRCMTSEHFRMNTLRRISHLEIPGAEHELHTVMEAIRELAAAVGLDLAETSPYR